MFVVTVTSPVFQSNIAGVFMNSSLHVGDPLGAWHQPVALGAIPLGPWPGIPLTESCVE